MNISNLEPEILWRQFDAILKKPRPSGKEGALRDYITGCAKSKGFEARQDKAGNVVILVPASPGYEKSDTTVLQGHLDMVCEKNSDVLHDFDNDPISPEIKGEYLYARGTTLGADNGIGVAAALAMMDESSPHGRLELLFTVDEETGLAGASTLDRELLTGRRLINLDSEEDGAIYVGCAGGGDEVTHLKATRTPFPQGTAPYKLAISGLMGGHSGLNIGENRANAIKLLARTLKRFLSAGLSFEISEVVGGNKRNAIPREAYALLHMKEAGAADSIVKESLKDYAAEFGTIEKTIKVELQHFNAAEVKNTGVIKEKELLIDLILAIPSGVLAMSRDIPGLVETSSNLGVLATKGDEIILNSNSRSSVAPALAQTREQVKAIGALAGARIESSGGYPGWQPDMSSPLLKKAREIYAGNFGKEALVKAVHAGLECGLIGEKFPGMDMISIGPEIHGAHSPDERVHIPSVGRFYEFLKKLLAAL
ncbi:MAG: aminoacyl-histidine dipeptidase [Deltaproteobacteria bacterium]|nr:aminoacyl-histidine dipeptidase [Deltaproteobacteria bacterium]